VQGNGDAFATVPDTGLVIVHPTFNADAQYSTECRMSAA
jgi:hypothetical protein